MHFNLGLLPPRLLLASGSRYGLTTTTAEDTTGHEVKFEVALVILIFQN